MPNQERKERALEALKKYRGRVTSEERIASFAAWFVEQECGWNDVKKEPPTDTMLVLLKDSKANVVRLDIGRLAEAGRFKTSRRDLRPFSGCGFHERLAALDMGQWHIPRHVIGGFLTISQNQSTKRRRQ